MTNAFSSSCRTLVRVPKKWLSKVTNNFNLAKTLNSIKEWFVTEGQDIEEFDELVEVQSDKATGKTSKRNKV